MSTELESTGSNIAISLTDVWVQYRLRHAHHYNFKRTLTNVATRKHDDAETITALKGISLDIPRGARLGLIGANGSGKSTLLAVMAGTLTPTRGSITTSDRILALLGGPNEGLDPEQTGRENAMSLGIRLGESRESMESKLEDIYEFSGLGRRFDHPVYTYSSGMQVRLRFTTITSLQAEVLLVDEGIGAADAEFNERAARRLQDFYTNAGTLVMTSHSRELLGRHCEMTLQLDLGSVSQVNPSHVTKNSTNAEIEVLLREFKYSDLLELGESRINPKWGVIFVKNQDSLLPSTVKNKEHLDFTALHDSPPTTSTDIACLGYNAAFGNLYHILMEWIPAIVQFKIYESSAMRLLLPQSQKSNSVITATLQLLEILDKVDWVDDSTGSAISYANLYFPDQINGDENFAPQAALGSLFSKIADMLDPFPDPNYPKRLYVARMDSGNRVLTNEADLVRKLCKDFGFVSVTLSGLPIPMQVALFRNAEFIVGCHGAGLTNLLFPAHSARTILEIQPSTYRNPCFKSLAELVGDTYMQVVVESSYSGSHQHETSWQISNAEMDIITGLVN